MPATDIIRLALVDDHRLFRQGVIGMLKQIYPTAEIVFEANDGIGLQKKLSRDNIPDLILMDINMPRMDGFASVQWLNEHFPEVKVLIVSMIEAPGTINRMKKLQVKGYLNKDTEPDQLRKAINKILDGGSFFTDDYLPGPGFYHLDPPR